MGRRIAGDERQRALAAAQAVAGNRSEPVGRNLQMLVCEALLSEAEVNAELRLLPQDLQARIAELEGERDDWKGKAGDFEGANILNQNAVKRLTAERDAAKKGSQQQPTMRLTSEQIQRAINEAIHIDASPHEWPKEDQIPLLCNAILDQTNTIERLADENRQLRIQLTEALAERDAVKAASEKDREALGRALDKQAEFLEQCQALTAQVHTAVAEAEARVKQNETQIRIHSQNTREWKEALDKAKADLEAARAGEARAVEALKAVVKELSGVANDVRNHGGARLAHAKAADVVARALKDLDAQPALAWLAQREREAAAEALLGLKDSIRGGTYRPHVAWRCISTRAAALRAGKVQDA